MDNTNQVSTTDSPTEQPVVRKNYSIGLIFLGVVLILLALAWAAPTVAYHFFGEKITISALQDMSVKELVMALAEDPGSPVPLVTWTILASPLPLLIFGIGLLWSARWAKVGAILTLLGQLAAVLTILHRLASPVILFGGEISLIDPPNKIYTYAAEVICVYGVLILFLLVFRAKKRVHSH